MESTSGEEKERKQDQSSYNADSITALASPTGHSGARAVSSWAKVARALYYHINQSLDLAPLGRGVILGEEALCSGGVFKGLTAGGICQ